MAKEELIPCVNNRHIPHEFVPSEINCSGSFKLGFAHVYCRICFCCHFLDCTMKSVHTKWRPIENE